MKEFDVYSTKGQKVDSVKLNAKIFDGKVNKTLMHDAVKMHLANQRAGAASTKNRAEVSGGSKKPWKQKGTGRARTGSIRSPLFKGGGVIFGPRPKDYSYSMPKKAKKVALVSAINAKINDGNMIIVEDIKLDNIKTKDFVAIFKKLKVEKKKVLVIVSDLDKNTALSARNIKNICLKTAENFNMYDVLIAEKLIITKNSLEKINKRVTL
jgi:large subunit ribosomal protein L4